MNPQDGPDASRDAPSSITRQPAVADDFKFCRCLYFSSMRPLLVALGAWDEQKAESAFRGYFDPREVSIIMKDGKRVGWIQISETESAVNLDQIHLESDLRGKGIGTGLMLETMAYARNAGKPLLLSLLRGNRAMSLYERLGFKPNGSDHTKLHMRWGPP
jgi:GNAT superfamily N-acetyltransferase